MKSKVHMSNAIIPIVLLMVVLGCGSKTQQGTPSVSGQNPTISAVEKPKDESRNADQWRTSTDGKLSFRISTGKKQYQIAESVKVLAELRNNGKSNISVLPIRCAFGNVGDAIHIVGPRKVRYSGPFKSMPRPKEVTLPPGKVVTAEAAIDDRYEGFGVPGEYKISCSFSGLTSTVSLEIISKEY